MESNSDRYSLDDLLYLMRRLRDPEDGCPWDVKQDYMSITSSTIEEAYEVVDAIERQDYAHLKEELGDFLFQAIFYCQLASEEDRFSFGDVVHGLTAKLLRRHPHVFPDGTLLSRRSFIGSELDEADVKASWESIKQQERNEKGDGGVFDDVPKSLPGLTRALKLQKRAAKVGFDWADKSQVVKKIEEELGELKEALAHERESEAVCELGDLIFTCVNLSRHLNEDPDSLLRQANKKFERRFQYVDEHMKKSGQASYSLDDMEALWQQAKRDEIT